MFTSALVAGGAGFIGSNLVKALSNQYQKIIIIDNLCRGKNSFIENTENKVFFNIDLADESLLLNTIIEIQQKYLIKDVWHMAANSDIPAGVSNFDIDFKDTFLTTKSLIRAFEQNPPDTFYFASSSAVYGDMGDKAINESSGPLLPISNYGAMKLASEAALSAWVEKKKINLRVLRFPNVVGAPSTHGVIFDFINKLKINSKELQVLGDGNQKKPYLLCKDLIEAMIFIKNASLSKREVINIGPNDDGVKVKEIAEIVCKKTNNINTKINFENKSYGWIGDIPRFLYDTKKLKDIGWISLRTSFEAIEAATIEILKSND